MSGNYFNDKENTLRYFLINNQIQVISLSIVENNMRIVCAACTCLGNLRACETHSSHRRHRTHRTHSSHKY
jgi:hypothetical protein